MIKSFTLIEILLVLAIIAILIGFGLPLSFDFYKNQQLETNSQGVVQALRSAQLKAMSIENDSIFGVYLTNDNYTLFKGSSYASRDVSYDEVSDLPRVVTVSGLQEIIFSKFEGLPSVTGNIILSNNNKSKTINVNQLGRVNLEL